MFTELLLCVRCGIKTFTYIISCNSHNHPGREMLLFYLFKDEDNAGCKRLKHLSKVTKHVYCLLSTYYIPGSVLSTLHVLIH